MSKKIAEGTRALVLDCKVGSGAFLATEAESRELARTMVDLGTEHGLLTRALLTDMNTRSAEPSATPSRSSNRWRCSPAAGPTTSSS